MENTNHEPIKSKNIDCRRFLNSDYIMFGCILTINCYILLVVGKITDGIDVFFKSLSCLQGGWNIINRNCNPSFDRTICKVYK